MGNHIQLKSCPFCGSAEVEMIGGPNSNGIFWAHCAQCHAEGPFPGCDPEQAAEKWNTRKEARL